MRSTILLSAMAAMVSLGACATDDDRSGRPGYAYRNHDGDRYDRSRDDRPRDGRYGRQLGKKDRIYRARDGRYYCKRSDGTRGAIIGALAGGVLGNVVAPGDSKTLGTLLGAGGGALAGRAIDRRNVRCE